jgi:hypothetical protein
MSGLFKRRLAPGCVFSGLMKWTLGFLTGSHPIVENAWC